MNLFRKRNTETTAQLALKQAGEVMDRVADAGRGAARKVAATGTKLREAEEKAVKAAGDYVRENPFKSTAITLALGAMAASAIIMSRRARMR